MRLSHRIDCTNRRSAARVAARIALALVFAPPLAQAQAVPPGHAAKLKRAREKIQHVVIIMQENRSFDSYFGTYPGADGIPQGTCVPINPAHPGKGCIASYHDPLDINAAGTHRSEDAQADIDDGITTAKMDGYVKVQKNSRNGKTGCPQANASYLCIALFQGVARYDVMGYHNAEDLPNYWAYAQNFVLQDELFAGVRTWSYPSHLDITSEWSATCTNPLDALSCVTDPSPKPVGNHKHITLPRANLFLLLDMNQVSWKYYVTAGSQPDCDDGEMTCATVPQQAGVASGWNPAPLFESVQAQGTEYLLQHNPTLAQFYTDLAAGTLPQVSWIVPNGGVAEHPPDRITKGMQYVTGIVNAIMQSSAWPNTAIFIAWDDWGGLYDHVDPPNVDTNGTATPIQGFGLRVPGIMISPYAHAGLIDSSVLSFDSYATFIEDLFTNSTRLDPAALGVPDNRPDIRDELTSVMFLNGTTAKIGDLLDEFDFTQPPLPPLILSTAIPTELTPACGAGIGNDFLCGSSVVRLKWAPLAQATGTPPYTYHVTRDGNDLPACATSGTSCQDVPGHGNHLYRIYSVDSVGTVSPLSAAVEADVPPTITPPLRRDGAAGRHG